MRTKAKPASSKQAPAANTVRVRLPDDQQFTAMIPRDDIKMAELILRPGGDLVATPHSALVDALLKSGKIVTTPKPKEKPAKEEKPSRKVKK